MRSTSNLDDSIPNRKGCGFQDKLVKLLMPNSPFRLSWELFIFLVIWYNSVVTPIRLFVVGSVRTPSVLISIDIALDFVFMIDTILNFYRPFIDKDTRKVVTDQVQIKARYLHSFAFYTNSIACTPILKTILSPLFDTNTNIALSTNFNIVRMIRIFHFPAQFEELKTFLSRKGPVNEPLFRMGIIIFVTQLVMCIFASVYFGVGSMAASNTCPGVDLFDEVVMSQELWMAKDLVILNKMSPSFCHNSDIGVDYACSDCPLNLFFFRSVYFLMQTLFTIGYGDNVVPSRHIGEICTACIFMICGVFGYGLTISNMTSVISNIDVVNMRFRHEMDNINKWLSIRSVPTALRNRVEMHCHYLSKAQYGMLDETIFNDLPKKLSQDISDSNIDAISRIPFFNLEYRSRAFLSKVAARMERRIYPPGSFILYEGEKQRDLVIVKKGRVELVLRDVKEAITTLIEGDFIGDYQLLFGTVNQVGVRSPDFTEVLVLTFDNFETIMDHPSQQFLDFRALGGNLRQSEDQGALDTMEQTRIFMKKLASKAASVQIKVKSKKILDLMDEGTVKVKGFRIFPDSKIHVYWDIFAILGIMYYTITFPVLLSSSLRTYSLQDGYSLAFVPYYVIDVMFMIDSYLRMTAYAYTSLESGRNEIVLDGDLIRQRYYASAWFRVDWAANLPLDFLAIFTGYHILFRISKLIRVLQLPKLVARLRHNLDECFQYTLNETQSSGIIMFLSSILIIVWCSSGWYSIRYTDSALEAVYWTLATLTTVGYGDITPSNLRETCYAIVVGAVGATFTAGIIANVTSFFHDIDITDENIEHKFNCTKKFLDNHSRSLEQVKRVQDYFDYMDREQGGVNEDIILNKSLPSHLKSSLVIHITSPLILNCELFSQCEAGFQRRLMTSLERNFFGLGTTIINRSIPSDGMYFVKKGQVELYHDINGCKKILKKVNVDEFFAEECLLEHWDQNPYIAESITDCELWHLRRSDFNRIIDDFPHVRAKLNSITRNRFSDGGRRGSISNIVKVFRHMRHRWSFYIHPDNYFIQIWFGVVLLITLYSVISLPFRIAFMENYEISIGWIVMDYGGDTLLVADLLIRSMFLAFYNTDNHLVVNRYEIMKNYLSSGKLKWHMIALFPIEVLFFKVPAMCPFWKLQMWSLFRLNKMIRFLEVPNLINRVESTMMKIGFRIPKNPLRLLKLFMVILLTGHFVSCIFFTIANYNDFHNTLPEYSNNWVRDEGLFFGLRFCPGIPIETQMVTKRYIASLYWALATLTTVGYGDISANINSSMEIVFSSLILVVGTGVYTLVIASLEDIVSQLDVTSSLHKIRTDKVEKYVKLDALPDLLKSRINAYYENLWNNHRGVRGEKLLEFFPRSFKNEMLLDMLSPLLHKTYFIKDCTSDFISLVLNHLRIELYLPDETIFFEGEKCDKLFYLYRGSVELLTSSLVKFKTVSDCILGEASFFGFEPYLCTAKSQDYCEAFTLCMEDFGACIHNCHLSQEYANYIRDHKNDLETLRVSILKMIKNLQSSKMGKMMITYPEKNVLNTVVLPNTDFRFLWDTTCFVSTIIFSFTIPYQFSFSNESVGIVAFTLDTFIDIFFILDIIARAQYFAIVKDGFIISEANEFRKHYLKNDFCMDLISVLPISTIFYISGFRTGVVYASCRVCQILRIRHFGSYLETLVGTISARTRFTIFTTSLRLVQIFFLVLFMCHWFACIYHYLGDIGHDSWLYEDGSIDETNIFLYFRSFYWSLYTVTTIGYGSIPVVTNVERVFSMFVMATGAVICDAGITAILTSIISMRDQQSGTNARRVQCSKAFMESNHISKDIQEQVLEYFRYVDDELENIMEDDILDDLSPNLQADILKHFCLSSLRNIPVFRDMSNGTINSYVKLLKPYLAIPGEHLSHINEESDYIYVLKRGAASSTDSTGLTEFLTFGSVIGHYITERVYKKLGHPEKALQVKILKAKGFKVKFGSPYLSVAIGTRQCRGQVQKTNIWNETIMMKLQETLGDTAVLTVKCWQRGQIHSELGTVSVPLRKCSKTGSFHNLKFKDSQGKICGNLHVNLSYRELLPEELSSSHELTTTALSYCHLYRVETYKLEDLKEYFEISKKQNISDRLRGPFSEHQHQASLTDKEMIVQGYRRPSRPSVSYSNEKLVTKLTNLDNDIVVSSRSTKKKTNQKSSSTYKSMENYRTRTFPFLHKPIYPSADENDPENIQEDSTATMWSGSSKVRTQTLALSMKNTSVEDEELLDGFSEYDKHWDQVVDFNEKTEEAVRRRTVLLEWA